MQEVMKYNPKYHRLETSLSDIPISRTVRYSLVLVLGQTRTLPYKVHEYHPPPPK